MEESPEHQGRREQSARGHAQGPQSRENQGVPLRPVEGHRGEGVPKYGPRQVDVLALVEDGHAAERRAKVPVQVPKRIKERQDGGDADDDGPSNRIGCG